MFIFEILFIYLSYFSSPARLHICGSWRILCDDVLAGCRRLYPSRQSDAFRIQTIGVRYVDIITGSIEYAAPPHAPGTSAGIPGIGTVIAIMRRI